MHRFETAEINEWKNFLIGYRFALNEMNTKLTILNEEFELIHNHNPIEHIKSRLKSPKSIIRKMKFKGLDMTQENVEANIRDIAGSGLPAHLQKIFMPS